MIPAVVANLALLCAGGFAVGGHKLEVAISLLLFLLASVNRARARARLLAECESGEIINPLFVTELALRRKLQEMRDTLEAKEWEQDLSTRFARPLEDHPLIKELLDPNRFQRCSTIELYQRVLTVVAGFTRAQAAGVVFRGESSINVVAYGAAGRRFEAHLRAVATEFWSGNKSVLGIHDAFETKTVWGGAGSFGYRYSFISELSGADGGHSAVLWLGYTQGAQPTQIEIGAARRLVVSVSGGLMATQRFAKMDSRVALAESDKARSEQMLTHVSHDIRTPLSNVKGILHLMSDPTSFDSKDLRELTRVALQNCEELGGLVGDVIDFTRGRIGQLVTKRELVDLHEICKVTVSNFSIAARRRGVKLNFSTFGPAIVMGDQTQLKRVLANVVGNALKYTEQGEVSIRLDEVAASKARIVIADTGIGMTEAQVASLFTPYLRFHTDRADGIGLGLAISKMFVENHGGIISVSSKLNVGSQFEIELPLLAAARAAPNEGVHSSVIAKPAVLLVDDDMDLSVSLARLLEQGGCLVECANTVKDAAFKLAAKSYHAVVTDLSMPGGGGYAILEAVQRLSGPIPAVFVVSGDCNRELILKLKARGVADVFEKPVEHSALLATVREWAKLPPVKRAV